MIARGDDAREAIGELRRQLSPQGDVVSPQGRAARSPRSASALTPQQVVERICARRPAHGLAAVLDYTARLDGVTLDPSKVRVSAEELRAAHADADPAYLKTLRRVRDNILAFQSGILHRDATLRRESGCELRLALSRRCGASASASPAARRLIRRRS